MECELQHSFEEIASQWGGELISVQQCTDCGKRRNVPLGTTEDVT